jgi:hypothetical protein
MLGTEVGTATGYGLDDCMVGVRFPAEAGNFSLRHRVQTASGAHPASYPVGTGGSQGVKRPAREADHSSPSSAEVKNGRSYTSTPPIRLHGGCLVKHRDNFTFTFTCENNYTFVLFRQIQFSTQTYAYTHILKTSEFQISC